MTKLIIENGNDKARFQVWSTPVGFAVKVWSGSSLIVPGKVFKSLEAATTFAEAS